MRLDTGAFPRDHRDDQRNVSGERRDGGAVPLAGTNDVRNALARKIRDP
jgi:hypothetical protein